MAPVNFFRPGNKLVIKKESLSFIILTFTFELLSFCKKLMEIGNRFNSPVKIFNIIFFIW